MFQKKRNKRKKKSGQKYAGILIKDSSHISSEQSVARLGPEEVLLPDLVPQRGKTTTTIEAKCGKVGQNLVATLDKI